MRLFFALWPGERVRTSLEHVSAVLAGLARGDAVPAAKIHLTLAFLGQVDDAHAKLAGEAAARTLSPRFELVLDEIGSFRRARVAWAGASRGSAGLLDFQARLDRALRARGFALEDRPFAAHVTLVRRIEASVARAPMPAIRWRPRELALVETLPGTGRYEIRQTWPLG
jgi:2'-5' RNA ligase